jgi:hypothetical protein
MLGKRIENQTFAINANALRSYGLESSIACNRFTMWYGLHDFRGTWLEALYWKLDLKMDSQDDQD